MHFKLAFIGFGTVGQGLAELLIGVGVRPAVVSRGYGGSAGEGPLQVQENHTARECGDEPRFLASKLKGAIDVVGSDRHAGAEFAKRQGVRLRSYWDLNGSAGDPPRLAEALG